MNGVVSAVFTTVPGITSSPAASGAASVPSIPGIPVGPTGPGIAGGPAIPGIPGVSTAPLQSSSGVSGIPHVGSGLASVVGVSAVIWMILLVLAAVAFVFIVLMANRIDPDPTGRRPHAVYFFGVSFVTIGTAIIGSAVIVGSLVQFVGSHSSPIADSVARSVLLGGLVTSVSVLLLVVHLRRGLALADSGGESPNPSRRIGQTYVSAVAFIAVLTLLVVAVLAVYTVFAIAGPGVFGSFGGRGPALRVLIESVYVGAVAIVVLWTHSGLIAPGLRILRNGGGHAGRQPAAAPPGEPPA